MLRIDKPLPSSGGYAWVILTSGKTSLRNLWLAPTRYFTRLDVRAAPKDKPPPAESAGGGLRYKCLTMTYFHRRTSTIIGAKAFHCPVRDGKEWGHLAMVVKRKGVLALAACCQGHENQPIWEEAQFCMYLRWLLT